jgi:Putative peptidoglycan binding domain
MGKATGIFLILAGVGTAALVLPAVDKDAERQLADVVRIATGGIPQRGTPVAAAPSATVTSAPLPSIAQAAPASAPASVATAAAPPVAAAPLAPPQVLTRNTTAGPARPTDTAARGDLARDIQKELKRVGCYTGDVSGEWTPDTRRAMKAFIDRVNASLPIDEPDHILRTMVQGHPGSACGKACPAGQASATDGRCLPAAIVAQRAVPKAAVPRDLTEPTSVAPLATGALQTGALAAAAGSVATGAVAAAETRTARPAAPKATWETTIATAPTAPLPGAETRMAIGGPLPPPAVAIVPSNGPRTPNAAGSLVLPGAIAALSGGPAGGAGLSSTSGSESPAQRIPVARPQKTAAVAQESEPEEKKAAPKPQQTQPRPQQRAEPAPIRRPPPPVVVYKYPTPSFLGFQAPKFVASGFPKPERSSFGPRVYENFVRNLR